MQLSEDEVESFVCGRCMYLAAAVHRLTGWPIEASTDPACAVYAETVSHAWCRNSETDDCIDIDGAYPIERSSWLFPRNRHVTNLDEDALLALVRLNSPGLTLAEWNADVELALPVARDYVLPLVRAGAEVVN